MNRFCPSILLLCLGLLFASSLTSANEAEPNPLNPHLVSEYREITPGRTHYLGVWLEHPEGYHSYWKGPGIVGVPTELAWDLPEGWSAGDIIWPPPQRVKMFDIDAHGYRGDAMLVVPVEVPADATEGEVRIKAKATWMCCSQTCHPGYRDLSITLQVKPEGTEQRKTHWFEIIQATLNSTPTPIDSGWSLTGEIDEEIVTLTAHPPEGANGGEVYFFDERGTVDSDADQERTDIAGGGFTLTMKRSEFGPKDNVLKGLLWKSGGWIDDREFLPFEISLSPRSKDEASGNK